MTTPQFGVVFNLIDTDPLPPAYGDFSVVALVLPSDDADASIFPLNTPVDVNTGDPNILAAIGTGALADAILAINNQLADLQRSARLVAVRVAGSETMTTQISNIVGDPTSQTGLYALLKAPSLLGVTPRLIGAPGYTGVTTFGVTSPVVTAQGSGYTSATVSFSPTGATATATVAAGKVTAINLTSPGNYASGTSVTGTISGDGTGATFTVSLEELANPICSALPAICEALMAHAIVGGPGTTKTDAINWQGTMNSKRLIPTDEWVVVATTDGGTKYIDGAANTIGLGVRCDFIHGGYPFWSFSNQPVQGILGLKRIDSFSLVDGATDAQELLAAGIGVTVRGDHTDVSLTDSGFSHISYRNASSDANWNLYNKTRGRDFIHLALLKSIRQRLGVDNVTPHGVQAVLNDMQAIAQDLTTRECLIGWQVGFRASDNTTAGLRAGKFTVFFNGEQPAPILVVTINSGLDNQALVAELSALETETDATVLSTTA